MAYEFKLACIFICRFSFTLYSLRIFVCPSGYLIKLTLMAYELFSSFFTKLFYTFNFFF